MSENFTPGPWRWGDDLADGSSILIHYAQWKMEPANRDLIAAVTLLYETVRELECAYARTAAGYRDVARRDAALHSARAALRAARGET